MSEYKEILKAPFVVSGVKGICHGKKVKYPIIRLDRKTFSKYIGRVLLVSFEEKCQEENI